MSYKTLLLHVEPTDASRARLRVVADFAKDIGAEVIGLGGRRPLIEAEPLVATFGADVAVRTATEFEAAELAESESAFHRLVPGGDWRTSAGVPVESFCEVAAGVDLVITGLERSSPDFAPATAATIMRAGIPVLALPVQQARISTDRIVIAWKNTREARRAVSDALPLLRRAQNVCVVSISAPSDAAASASSVDDVLQRLARHGVRASHEALSTRHDPARELLRFAVSRKDDLIVTGGFGHSRAGEWLLGGMTQSLLEQSTLPILFSH
jgi:nucleotide-binding universal stress UspA family protein